MEGDCLASYAPVLRGFVLVPILAGAVLGALFAWPGDAFGQTAFDRRCWAPRPSHSERTDWYDAEGNFVRDTSVRSVASLARRFAGTYRLLVVTSEGDWEREIIEYRMTLAPPTPTQKVRIARIPAAADGRLQVPLVAVLAYSRGVRGREPVTGRPRGDLSGEVNFEYWPSLGKIGFNVGLGFDTGTLFQVTDVTAAGPFRGRWSDGGYGASELATSIEPVLEQARGYFCALPR